MELHVHGTSRICSIYTALHGIIYAWKDSAEICDGFHDCRTGIYTDRKIYITCYDRFPVFGNCSDDRHYGSRIHNQSIEKIIFNTVYKNIHKNASTLNRLPQLILWIFFYARIVYYSVKTLPYCLLCRQRGSSSPFSSRRFRSVRIAEVSPSAAIRPLLSNIVRLQVSRIRSRSWDAMILRWSN